MSGEDFQKLNAALGLGGDNVQPVIGGAENVMGSESDTSFEGAENSGFPPPGELSEPNADNKEGEGEAAEGGDLEGTGDGTGVDEGGDGDTGGDIPTEKLMAATVELPTGETISVQDAVQGYMRSDHHTQSLQQNAASRQEYMRVLGALNLFENAGWEILAPDLNRFKDVNLESLAASNPQQYQQIKPIHDALMQRATAFQHKVAQIKEAVKQVAQSAEKSQWEQIDTDLGYSVPGYGKNTMSNMKEYAKKMGGFTDQEIAVMADSRIWKLVSKAMAYDKVGNITKPAVKGSKRPGVKVGNNANKSTGAGSTAEAALVRRGRAGDQSANLELLRRKVKV